MTLFGREMAPEAVFVAGVGLALAVAAWAIPGGGWLSAVGCLLGMAVAMCGRWLLASARDWRAGLTGVALIGFGAHAVLFALGRPEAQAAGLAIGLALVYGWQARSAAMAAK